MKNLSLLFFAFVFLLACQNNKTEQENKENEKTAKEENDSKKDKEENKEKSLKDKITGTWTWSSVGGEKVKSELVFTFNADGTATGVEKDKPAKWDVKEKDGKNYIIVITDKTEENEIKSIDDKQMVIIDKDQDVVLTRK